MKNLGYKLCGIELFLSDRNSIEITQYKKGLVQHQILDNIPSCVFHNCRYNDSNEKIHKSIQIIKIIMTNLITIDNSYRFPIEKISETSASAVTSFLMF